MTIRSLARSVLAALLVLMLATLAFSQTLRTCKDADDDTVVCASVVAGVETPMPPTIIRFGEGVVHAPGSELAWVVVANYDPVPVTVTLRFLVQGVGLVTRTFDVGAHARNGYPVHDDPLLAGLRTFSTRAYVPGDVDVSLVLRPQTNPWSHVTLPPADTTRP